MWVVSLLLLCAGVGMAESLAEYHSRVRDAIRRIDSIQTRTQYESIEGSSSADSAIEEVRRALPENVTVQRSDGQLRVDNKWLAEAIDTYRSMSPEDPQRPHWLMRIRERLQAIDERLLEMQARPGTAAAAVDKEQEKARLAAILRREEYTRQAAEGNALTRIIKRIRDWLRSLLPRRESREPEQDSPAVNRFGHLIVGILSLAVILYVVWRFLPRLLRREMKKRKKEKKGARVVLGEQLSMEESSADLLSEAEQLALAGDIRGAIRKGYIAMLCELHDRKLLRLEQHKTNRDYLRAVEANPTLYEEMKPMTMSFENHWYGLIPASETDWQAFRAHYRKAVVAGER